MRFWQCLGIMLVFGALATCKYAAGEEIGWRGYMLTRLVDSGIRAPILISGLVWGLWHAPLILSGQYASGPHPVLSAGLFLAGIVAAGYVFAWLRLSSGSIWPCIWGHSVWNAVIQGAFDRSTSGGNLWVGESGGSPQPRSLGLQLCSIECGRWSSRSLRAQRECAVPDPVVNL